MDQEAAVKSGTISSALRGALFGLAVLLTSYSSPRASLSIDGTADKLVMDVDQEPLRTVLDALSARLGLTIKYTPGIDDRVRGRFSGPLTEVIRELFREYDFAIVKRRDAKPSVIEIIAIRRSLGNSIPSPLQASPTTGPREFDGFK